MRSRLVRALVLGALVVGLVAVQGSSLASGDEKDDPVGYTFGQAPTAGNDVGFCNFYKVNLESGALTQVNPTGATVPCGDGLTFDEDGTLYGYRIRAANPPVGSSVPADLIKIDPHNGAQHVVGTLPQVRLNGGMTFDADGHLWLYAVAFTDPQCLSGSTCLWKVDPKTALAEFIGSAPPGVIVGGLTGDCEDVIGITTRQLIESTGDAGAAAGSTTATELDDVHTSNGSLEKIVDLPGVGFPSGLDFDGDGTLWALATRRFAGGFGAGATVNRIDPDNGNVTAKTVTLNGAIFTGFLSGLGIAPISCEDPDHPTPPQPAPVVVQPVFTG